jgi:hypothetical protein
MQTVHGSLLSKTIKEQGSDLEAQHLTYKCPKCGGYEVYAELHPMEKQRHTNEAHHLRLFLRCARLGCGEMSLTGYGAVENRKRFVIHRFPRS